MSSKSRFTIPRTRTRGRRSSGFPAMSPAEVEIWGEHSQGDLRTTACAVCQRTIVLKPGGKFEDFRSSACLGRINKAQTLSSFMAVPVAAESKTMVCPACAKSVSTYKEPSYSRKARELCKKLEGDPAKPQLTLDFDVDVQSTPQFTVKQNGL